MHAATSVIPDYRHDPKRPGLDSQAYDDIVDGFPPRHPDNAEYMRHYNEYYRLQNPEEATRDYFEALHDWEEGPFASAG